MKTRIITVCFFLSYVFSFTNADAQPMRAAGVNGIKPAAAAKTISAAAAAAAAANPNGSNIDLTAVRFDLTVNPALATNNANLLNGSVTYTFKTTKPNVVQIKFDFYRTATANVLSGDRFVYNGVSYTLTAAHHPQDTLIINLPAPIVASGSTASLTIFFHGNPPQSNNSRGYKKNFTGASTNYIISTHSSGYFARQWWPTKHVLGDKIDQVEFFITCPSAYKAVANGILQTPNPPIVSGNKTWHWKSTYPVAHYLIAFAVNNYVVYNSPAAMVGGVSVPIANYLTTATNTATVRGRCDAMKPVLEHFGTLFGDYPFKNEKYGHVAYTFGGGMENQTGSYIGTSSLSHSNDGFSRSLLAHELAHQWWGDKVTCDSWANVWVNEGFARYSEILYSEQFETIALANTKRAGYKNSARSTAGEVFRYDTEIVTETDHGTKIFNNQLVYDKASIIVSMLRKLVGDVKFFATLKAFMNDPSIAYGYASTEDVQRHFEIASGQNLTSFFDDFIYKRGYPSYNVEWKYTAAQQAVSLRLNQTRSAGATASYFNTVLPVRLRKTSAPARDTIVYIFDSGDGIAAPGTLSYKVSFPVESIDIDPFSESYAYDNTFTPNAGLLVVLPVSLISFDAALKNNQVQLSWRANNAVDFSHFEIERSADATEFYKMASVPVHTNGEEWYASTDNWPLSGANYYRLKMVDIDGSATYSKVIYIPAGTKLKMTLAPNPATDVLKAALPWPATRPRMHIIDSRGMAVPVTRFLHVANTIDINVRHLPVGLYWLEVYDGNRRCIEQFIIHR